MKTTIILMSFLLITAVGCKKKEGCTDPAATNYDPDAKKNCCCEYPAPPSATFTAKVNGVDFICSSPLGSVVFNTDLKIDGYAGNYYMALKLNDFSTKATGTYVLGDVFDDGSGHINLSVAPYTSYQTDSPPNTGTITFTKFDKTNKVVSGTFSFQAVDLSTNATINITNGVFANISY